MKCPKHPRTEMEAIYEPNCGCCGDGELIEWVCPIDKREEEKAYKNKLNKIANVCLEGGFISEKGEIIASSFNTRYVIYPHGGHKKNRGRYVTLSSKGYLVYSKNPTNLIVVK